MTREEKNKVLTELDGWKEPMSYPGSLPRYLTSYDAIIPLVKKLCVGNALLEQTFINEVERGICSGFHAARTVGFFLMAAEPDQLADALIKAVGKWRE